MAFNISHKIGAWILSRLRLLNLGWRLYLASGWLTHRWKSPPGFVISEVGRLPEFIELLEMRARPTAG